MREGKRNTNPRLTCKVKSQTTQNLLKGTQNSKKKSKNQQPVFRLGRWGNGALSPVQQSQELFASLGAGSHTSQHTAGSGGAANLLHTTHNHAKVGGFHNDTDAARLEDL